MPLFRPIVVERSDERHVRQLNKDEAIAEAQRLARANPGQQFAVYLPYLYVVSAPVPPPPVKHVSIESNGESPGDIPF